jgi:hypothetical protein
VDGDPVQHAVEDTRLVENARLRAETIRQDVALYERGREAFTDVRVLARWNLDYLLETAAMLDALADAVSPAPLPPQ